MIIPCNRSKNRILTNELHNAFLSYLGLRLKVHTVYLFPQPHPKGTGKAFAFSLVSPNDESFVELGERRFRSCLEPWKSGESPGLWPAM